jgi:uncharacterized protein
MNGNERRKKIIKMLLENKEPLSGTYLSKVIGVSMQVIVQDIAILRAEGNDIMATPQGYIIPDRSGKKYVKRIIACIHNNEGIEDELKTIISMGGRIIDVMVEHPAYGEIRGMLMLSSIYDADQFVKKLKESVGQPLLVLTNGIHLHTIEAEDDAKLYMIENRLRDKGYLIDKGN